MAKIESDSPTKKTLWVQAAPSQSEDIIDIQDSDGNSYAVMDKDGNVTFYGSLTPDGGLYENRKYRYCGVEGDVSYTDNGGGNITVAAGYAYMTTDAVGKEPVLRYTIPEKSATLTDGVVNYVVAKYNGGSPIYIWRPRN